MKKPSRQEHINQVRAWVAENVTTYDEITSMVLFGFECEPEKFGGEFRVKFDGVECPYQFSFSLGSANGDTQVYEPVFHSPLGAPASYGAIEMPEAATRAIEDAIRELFPRMRPFGLNRQTGQETDAGTPMRDRLPSWDAYVQTVKLVSEPAFELPVELQN